MNNYELTIVLPGTVTSAQKKAKVSFIESLVGVNQGKITKTDEWGVKDLAYKIEKHPTGLFIYFELELNPSSVREVSDKIRLEDGIIRSLLVKNGKKS